MFRPDTDTSIAVNTHTYVAWAEAPPLTFEMLADDCKANGCNVDSQYSVDHLRYEYAHWQDGQERAPDLLTTEDRDLEPVAAWLGGLHTRMDREGGERLASAGDIAPNSMTSLKGKVQALVQNMENRGFVFEDRA